jgi:surface polysaccharide O-acyltransferase-like enzyme
MSERRIVFVDAARGLAVVLALFIHSLATFGSWYDLPVVPRAIIRVFTSAATPTFIVLFGAMLELIYYRALLVDGPQRVQARLLRRSVNCYVAYLATVAAGVVSGRRTISAAIAAALSLGDARYGNILKFYAIALVLAIPLLMLRRRKGLGVTVVLGLGLWAFVPLLDYLPWPAVTSRFSYVTGTLFGRPIGRSWISLLHSQALVVVGMTIGWGLTQGLSRQRWTALYRTFACVIAGCLAIGVVLALQMSVRQVIGSYLTMRFRQLHHIGYYSLGLLEATALIAALAVILPPRLRYGPRLVPVLTLGRSSLLSFTLGNCLLNFWPLHWHLSVAAGIATSLCIPVVVLVLVLAIEAVLHESRLLAPAPAPAVLAGSRDG